MLELVTAGGMSSLLLEGLKWLIRKIGKNPSFDFPMSFYLVAIPVLNIIVIPLLAIVGFETFTIPTDWMGWVKDVLQVLVASLISAFAYNTAVKPMKDYRKTL